MDRPANSRKRVILTGPLHQAGSAKALGYPRAPVPFHRCDIFAVIRSNSPQAGRLSNTNCKTASEVYEIKYYISIR